MNRKEVSVTVWVSRTAAWHWTASLITFFLLSDMACVVTTLRKWGNRERPTRQWSMVFHFIFPSHSPAIIFVFMMSGPMDQVPVNYKHLLPSTPKPDVLEPGKRSSSPQGTSWKFPSDSVSIPVFCFGTSTVFSHCFSFPSSPHLPASRGDMLMAEKYKKAAWDQELREVWSNPCSILSELCDLDQMTVLFLIIGFLHREQTWVLKDFWM